MTHAILYAILAVYSPFALVMIVRDIRRDGFAPEKDRDEA